jgi:anionic cell wall polymer biosynthesis LytR-Cps2A-Psr (LCP) family protein
MSTAMGGVDVIVPETVTDPQSGITWEKGPVHLEGERAVHYVRQRYALPRGDFDRIQRQQNVLRAMLDKIVSAGTLANPLRVTRLVTTLSSFVAVDDGFTPAAMRSLALSSRGIRPSNMRFVTVPVTGTPTIDGASVVTLDMEKTAALFDAVERDHFEDWLQQNTDTVDELPPAGQVR